MIWINIKTTTLRESEYISASPTQQATWLKLLAYCSEHENGGIIAGAGDWNERAWLFGCGITLDEVRERCGLWLFDESGNLRVWNYPAEKELEVIAKREAGRRGGFTKAQNRSTASSSARAQPVAVPVAESTFATSSAPTEGVKGRSNADGVMRKEEKEEHEGAASASPAPAPKEPKAKRARFAKPTVEEWTGYAKAMPNALTENQAIGAWDHYEANGWRVGRNPMVDWRASLRKWGSNQREFSQASRPQHKPPVSRNGSGFTMTEQQRIDLDADSLPDNI
jgi:pyruvate/2-oxoglutarate dehydrogenase complex dihydrolipoamide acyltransferase (E2) component